MRTDINKWFYHYLTKVTGLDNDTTVAGMLCIGEALSELANTVNETNSHLLEIVEDMRKRDI